MIKFKTLPATICVDCSDLGFGDFNVLIVPCETETTDGQLIWQLYLRHPEWGVVVDMFGCGAVDAEEAAEIAHSNAIDYIPDFIEQCKL